MNKVLTRGIITIAAVNDGKDGHSLTAKASIEGSYRNGRTKGVKSYVKVFYDGQEVKDFTVSYRYKGAGQADWVKPQTNKEDFWVDAQRDGSTLFVEYTVEYKGLKAVATGRLDNIQDGKDGLDAVVFRLIPKIEKAVVHGTKREKAKVVLFLKYMITRKEGEKHYLELGRLDSFGLSLSIEPSRTSFEVKWEDDKPYWVIKSIYDYADYFDNTPFFRVCLMQGGKVLDARTIGLQYEAEVNFDFGERIDGIDGKIDGISGTVNSLDGKVSGFETTIDHFRTEVKDKVSHSELKQTADGIVAKVGSSVNANLLWGSDLDLSQVQDVINRAYELGNSIKKKTEEKAEWKRKRDQAGSDDDRIRYQEGMDDCDREIAQAQGEVAKCKAAIAKRLGVVISGGMEIGNRDMFEYLKGEGVGGSDAIHFKNAYKREGWGKWTNISWQDVPLKPHTRYTISVWVKFKSYGRKGCMYVDCASDDGRYCFGGYLYKEHHYDRADIDEWQRVRYVFDSGASKRLSGLFFSCIADEEEDAQCEIWLCHPKLEEGEVATPWCAYDGTVDALLDTGLDIKNRRMTFTTDNFVIRNNKGEVTVTVDKNGMLEFYGRDKEFPGIRFGVNEHGEMVLEFWRRGVKLYDLGPDNVFNKLDNVESVFTPMNLTRVKFYNNSSGERCVRTDVLYDPETNPNGLAVFRFSEGYKLIGGARRYNVSGKETPSGYDGIYFFGSVKTPSLPDLFGGGIDSLKRAQGDFVSAADAHKIDMMARNPFEQAPNTTIEVVNLRLGYKSSSVETIGGGNGVVTVKNDEPTVDIPGLPPGWKPPHIDQG